MGSAYGPTHCYHFYLELFLRESTSLGTKFGTCANFSYSPKNPTSFNYVMKAFGLPNFDWLYLLIQEAFSELPYIVGNIFQISFHLGVLTLHMRWYSSLKVAPKQLYRLIGFATLLFTFTLAYANLFHWPRFTLPFLFPFPPMLCLFHQYFPWPSMTIYLPMQFPLPIFFIALTINHIFHQWYTFPTYDAGDEFKEGGEMELLSTPNNF